jgi:hypothetical protein
MAEWDHYAPLNEWRKAKDTVLRREGKRLFEGERGVMGGYYVKVESRAWCCAQFTAIGSSASKGPQKVKAHLRTANHFREWCIEHRDKAIERFPEVKAFFAEYELTKVEKPTHTVTSTTSIDPTGSMGLGRALLGRKVP